jgi:hypothetical protein
VAPLSSAKRRFFLLRRRTIGHRVAHLQVLPVRGAVVAHHDVAQLVGADVFVVAQQWAANHAWKCGTGKGVACETSLDEARACVRVRRCARRAGTRGRTVVAHDRALSAASGRHLKPGRLPTAIKGNKI